MFWISKSKFRKRTSYSDISSVRLDFRQRRPKKEKDVVHEKDEPLKITKSVAKNTKNLEKKSKNDQNGLKGSEKVARIVVKIEKEGHLSPLTHFFAVQASFLETF